MPFRSCPINTALKIAAVLAGMSAFFGCSGGDKNQVVPVSGKVLLDGQPLTFGSVTFQPSRGQPAHGAIDAQGGFKLSTYRDGDGAAVGRHKVKITSYSSQDPKTKSGTAASDSLGESLIPVAYTGLDTSGLEVAVLAGGNKPFVFELKSMPKDEPKETSAPDGAEKTSDKPLSGEKSAPVPDKTQQPPAEPAGKSK